MTEPTKPAGRRNPAIWVPTLYYTQGFPYTTVMEMATVFFKAAGVSLEALGIFQGIFNLPWAFKFIWSPLVDLLGTKRRWILVMQWLLAAALITLTLAVLSPQTANTLSLRLFMLNFGDNWANAGFTIGILLIMFSLGFGMDARRAGPTRAACFTIAATVVVLFILNHARLFNAQTIALPSSVWLIFLAFLAIAFFSATHDIAIDGFYLDALDVKAQAAYSGIRVMFYRVAMVMGSGVLLMIAGKRGWPLGFGIGAAVFSAAFLFHLFYLPHPARAVREAAAAGAPRKSFTQAFTTYLDQKRIILILMFIILFRIDDSFWKPMAKPFLMVIGVSVAQMGFLQGVVGIAATIVGALAGGFYIAKRGLTRSLWVLGVIQSANLLLYAWLAYVFPVLPKGAAIAHSGLIQIGIINALENFSIGLGTIAFVNFIMRTCKKEYTAAHYAIATSLMALSSMFASFFSGFLAVKLGWTTYFVFCFYASIPGLIVLAFLPLKELTADETLNKAA